MHDALIDKRNSMIIRGGGILLMLIHHLFYSKWSQDYYDDIVVHGIALVNQLGIFSKLCVAIFVFSSGYGLVVSTPKDIKLKDFYWYRFRKLYLNYWFVWLLFVPIGIYVFGRTFSDAYGDHVAIKGALDIFGLLSMFNIDSYNPTWWFYNCILILYLLFPLLNKVLWRAPYLTLSVALTIGMFGFIPGINVIASYLFVFITGMLVARMPLKWINNTNWWQIVIALILLSVWRMSQLSPKHIVDAMLCVGIAFLIYKQALENWVGNLLALLGKHSMNMFLIHTFIFYFWFPDYIYITRNPLLILLSLVVTSLLCSVAIERVKNMVDFYKLLQR